MVNTYPTYTVPVDEVTGNGGSAWDTIVQFQAGASQGIFVTSIEINTTTTDTTANYGIRLQRQGADASGDMSAVTPGSLNLSWGYDGTVYDGSLGASGASEPTAYSGAGGALVWQAFRSVGAPAERWFDRGEWVYVPAGGFLGLQVKDGSGLTYSGDIRFTFFADS